MGARRANRIPVAAACCGALALLAGCSFFPVEAARPRFDASPSALRPADHVAHPLGAGWAWSRLDAAGDYLERLAGGATWHEVVWCDIEEEPGQRDWSRVDRVARLSRQLGYTLNLKIRTGACWATVEGPKHVRGVKQKSESHMPRVMRAYAQFVRTVVQRYESYGVRKFAIENEPNAPWFWGGSVNGLVTLTRVGAVTIRAANPQARVVSWGVSSETYGWGVVAQLLTRDRDDEAVAAYNRYFARRPRDRYPVVSGPSELRGVMRSDSVARDLRYLRAAGRLLESGVFDIRQVHFYEAWRNVPALADYLDATTPKGVHLEAWEAGQYWVDVPAAPGLRGTQVTKTVALLLAHDVRRVIWVPLMVDPGRGGDEKRYGLLEPAGDMRPAGAAYARMAQWSRNVEVTTVTVDGLQGALFAADDTTRLVVWSPRGRTLERPEDVTVRASDMEGNAVRWPERGLRVTGQPLFLHIDAPKSEALRLLRS